MTLLDLCRGPRRIFYGWLIVAGGFVIQLLNGSLLFHAFTAYILPLQAEFGWSRAALSGAFSMARAEGGILGPLQGWLIDRYGPRQIMRIGNALFGLGFILFSRMHSLPTFYASFACIALGSSLGGLMPIATTVTNWFARRRATALGIAMTGTGTGGLFIPLVVACLSAFGWRNTAFVSGLVILAVGVPVAQVMRHRPEDYGYLPDGDDPPSPAQSGPGSDELAREPDLDSTGERGAKKHQQAVSREPKEPPDVASSASTPHRPGAPSTTAVSGSQDSSGGATRRFPRRWPASTSDRRAAGDTGTSRRERPCPRETAQRPSGGRDFTAREALRTPAFWLLATAHACALLVVGAVLVHQVPHMVEGIGMSTEQAAANVALLVSVNVASQLLGGYAGDHVSKRLLMFACMWMHASGLVIFAFASTRLEAALFAVLHGAAWGVRGLLINAVRADYFGRKAYASITGYNSLLVTVGMSSGPLFSGFLFDIAGNYRTPFLVLAALSAFGSVAMFLARKPSAPAAWR